MSNRRRFFTTTEDVVKKETVTGDSSYKRQQLQARNIPQRLRFIHGHDKRLFVAFHINGVARVEVVAAVLARAAFAFKRERQFQHMVFVV